MMQRTFLCVRVFVCSSVVWALLFLPANAAEIININYKYKIAFADLTENDVKPGALVQVRTSAGAPVYLKVFEAYPVMTKLVIADDAEHVLTDEQFSQITVGSVVSVASKDARVKEESPARKPAPAKVVARKQIPAGDSAASGAADEDATAHLETYSPGTAPRVMPEAAAEREVPQRAATLPTAPAAISAASDASVERVAMLEKRLDQLMASNVKLSENVAQFVAEKNAAEDKVKAREAEIATLRQKMADADPARAQLEAQVKGLQSDVAALRAQKADADKEIQSLNIKLVELKKKLARMVEIINNNMKAYE